MHTLRKYLCWIFALTCLIGMQLAAHVFLRSTEYHTPRMLIGELLELSIYLVVVLVFGIAWWTVWRDKPSGRRWAITASSLNLLTGLAAALFCLLDGTPILALSGIFLVPAIGIAGLVAFWRRYNLPTSSEKALTQLALPGDGTSAVLNQTAPYLIFGVAFLVYILWTSWLKTKGLEPNRQGGQWFLVVCGLAFLMTALHELGHAVVGVALGMRLAAFVAGPFEWRIREGKWEFRFNPGGILIGAGVTGIVPSSPGFSLRNYVCMAGAGTFANLLSGTIALWIAVASKVDSPWQADGLLALFGAWSLVLGPLNILPLRTPNGYSDGAQIYQLLSHGPWGDFRRVVAMVGSTIVTPLRPRNYEIDTIQRTGLAITQGQQGLLLQLFAYSHFFDQGNLDEAGEALLRAEAIYNQSASNIPPELHTVFVFGNAFVRRDAAAARGWWTRMQAKKPTRFNVDYWRAFSALHWIEGDLTEADCALKKAEELAEKLPEAGAYEFDRYCNSLLRNAIDAGSPTCTANNNTATEQIVG